MNPSLFSPLNLRGVQLRNRIGVSPMCQYSSVDGLVNDWHLAHYGSMARGGAGMVITEAAAVEPAGRISYADAGIWNDEQVQAWKPITHFIEEMGALPAIQLAHAGRKASTRPPFEQGPPLSPEHERGWHCVAPSPLAFSEQHQQPLELSEDDLELMLAAWSAAARRAEQAGFRALELHMAHGYLLHSFLSPLSNQREDCFGGSFDNRIRFPLALTRELRELWPESLPLIVRLSATDWLEGGWTVEQSIELSRKLFELGVDMVDLSSGGAAPQSRPPQGPEQQQEIARRVRSEVEGPVAAVGGVREAVRAQELIETGAADMVLVGRAHLVDPHWALHAALELGAEQPWPAQYQRAL